MQWMTVTSLVPCRALHVSQHNAVSLSEPLNQVIFSARFYSFYITVVERDKSDG